MGQNGEGENRGIWTSFRGSSDFWLEQYEIESNGGQMLSYDKEGNPEATFASQEGIDALQGMSDLINKDGAATYILGESVKEAFTSGKWQ